MVPVGDAVDVPKEPACSATLKLLQLCRGDGDTPKAAELQLHITQALMESAPITADAKQRPLKPP